MMGGPTPLPVVSEGQTYCLRWNNHKSNLVEILDALIKVESYVDCTIVVDDQVQFKAHRVVLAANSPYFQAILQDVPMDHCSIIFPGVKAFEMRALLEYMYTGEVNVTQSQIPKIMRIAEELEVKGLFDMADLKEKFNKLGEEHTSEPYGGTVSDKVPAYDPAAATANAHNGSSDGGGGSKEDLTPHHSGHHSHLHHQNSSSVISTSSPSAVPSSSSSPPYGSYKSPYSSLYSKSPGQLAAAGIAAATAANSTSQSTSNLNQSPATSTERSSSQWPLSPSAATAAMLSSVYESGPDMNPLKRKKLSSISSMLLNRDTPILRNVLAQANPADSSQPMSLLLSGASIKGEKSSSSTAASSAAASAVAAAAAAAAVEKTGILGSGSGSHNNNHSFNGSEYSSDKKYHDEPHSPYTDRSFEDDGYDAKGNSYGGNFGSSASNQKPEWKRYKQYTRNDIMSAIQCVRDGMSALQASRKFGVPSRTLYDKVKKLGITTGRPMNRTMKRSPSNAESSAAFPYAHGYGQSEPLLASLHEARSSNRDDEREPKDLHRSSSGGEHHHMAHATLPHPAAALLDHAFLQQALENRGGDIAGREALHAMALAAAAHAAANRMSTSPGPNGNAVRRSPSPTGFALKYAAAAAASGGGREAMLAEQEKERRAMDVEHELDLERERERDRDREREREREIEHVRQCKRERDLDFEDNEHDNEADDEGDDQVEDLSVARKEASLTPSPEFRRRRESMYSPPPALMPSANAASSSASTENGNSGGVIVPPLSVKLAAAAAAAAETSPAHSVEEYAVKNSTPIDSTSLKREILSDDGRAD